MKKLPIKNRARAVSKAKQRPSKEKIFFLGISALLFIALMQELIRLASFNG